MRNESISSGLPVTSFATFHSTSTVPTMICAALKTEEAKEAKETEEAEEAEESKKRKKRKKKNEIKDRGMKIRIVSRQHRLKGWRRLNERKRESKRGREREGETEKES